MMDARQRDLEHYGSVTEAPLVVKGIADIHWHDEADVVVIGFGAAGSCAAIEARDLGGDVIIVERFDGGGSCAYSGGIVYASGTRQQRTAGFDDNPDEMVKYMLAEGVDAVVSESKIREYSEQSAGC